jgi:hypothetical protein
VHDDAIDASRYLSTPQVLANAYTRDPEQGIRQAAKQVQPLGGEGESE